MLWGIARVFKRGLTPANGAILGAFLGLGLLGKLTLLAFVPAAAAAVAILLWRGLRRHQPGVLAGAGWAVGLGGVADRRVLRASTASCGTAPPSSAV